MTKQLSKRTDVAYSRAKTLVRTETSEIHNKATLDAYREMEVEKYEFVAVLDSSTTHICQELDLEQFPVSEAEVGVNYPPMHYNCRSTTVEVLPDWPPMHYNCRSTTVEVLPDWLNEIAGDEERSARDDSGKTYKVHGDMAYDEWYDRYVNGNDYTPDIQIDGLEELGLPDEVNEAINDLFSEMGEIYPEMKNVNATI